MGNDGLGAVLEARCKSCRNVRVTLLSFAGVPALASMLSEDSSCSALGVGIHHSPLFRFTRTSAHPTVGVIMESDSSYSRWRR